jgi:DMSO/TMAO reductase YedYZ molybdopterin-dependent catalytic subunit
VSAGRARRWALLEGGLAAAASLAAGWIVHRGTPDVPSAPTAIADRIIRLAPGDIATAAIDRLQHAAQPLLAVTVAATLMVLGGAIAWRLRSPAPAAVAWGALVLGGGLAAPIAPAAVSALGSAAIAAVTYGAALRAMRSGRERARPDPARRRAVVLVGALAGAAVLASHPLARAIAWMVGRPRRPGTGALPHAAVPARAPFPKIAGLSDEITGVADHYVVDIDIDDPLVDASGWRLQVRGLVQRPLDLGFLDLQREFQLVDEISVLTCISNPVGGPLVGCSRWEGVPLAALLRRADPKPSATALVVRCADGYTAGIPLAAARHPSALLAIAQDGRALTRQHGFPARLRLPALYGMLNPKWVQSIELVDHPYLGYWARQGWSPTAVVRTQSRVDAPRHARAGEPTWIAGVAWAGTRGISMVEVSTDGIRTWQPARLRRPLSPWAWTQWALRWTPSRPGHHIVACRATDGRGVVQDARERAPHPSGASGYHRVTVAVT